jgi:hypothetical protein
MVNNPEQSSCGLRFHCNECLLAYTLVTQCNLTQVREDSAGLGFDNVFVPGLVSSAGHQSQADSLDYEGLSSPAAFIKSNSASN